ncbi:hypothetical protein JXB41_03245 [Candidatus Woesearchaeota archaeon]|nr:hypothetical protein [Candidatus Woesearchaeota archaeon]
MNSIKDFGNRVLNHNLPKIWLETKGFWCTRNPKDFLMNPIDDVLKFNTNRCQIELKGKLKIGDLNKY